jgi:predicted PurR-regulated permease PerM
MTPTPTLPKGINRQRLVQYFFFAAFLLLFWQGLRLLAPFIKALMGSAILALLVHPVHEWLLKRLPTYPSMTAAASTALTSLIVVVPILALAWVSVRETAKVYPVAQKWVSTTDFFQRPADSWIPKQLEPVRRLLGIKGKEWRLNPEDILLKNLNTLSKNMTRFAGNAIKNTLSVVFNLLILIFTLFFFLRDGPYIVRRLVELIPMAPRNKAAVLNRLQVTLYAVIRGVFVVAILQGILAGVGYALFSVPFPAMLGLLTAFLGVIPFIGPAAIWVPVSGGLLLSGATQNGILVAAWGLCIVSVVDNFLRPMLISSDAKLPMLLMFFSIVGGLRVYGFFGILLGPVMTALLLAFINIYRREYKWLLNPSEKAV